MAEKPLGPVPFYVGDCHVCGVQILDNEPRLHGICTACLLNMIPEIYGLVGCGGFQHVIFKMCLSSDINRKKRVPIARYRETLQSLKEKYNFSCVKCGAKEGLTIDHIQPVSKGGTNDIENLQIMCKPCNSRKGNRVE